jgi:hypothetical protein
MARPVRFELTTPCSGGMYSIHLSYGRAEEATRFIYQFSVSDNPPLVDPLRSDANSPLLSPLRSVPNVPRQFFDFFRLLQ